MPRWLRGVLLALLVLLLVAAAAYAYLTAREEPPETSDYVIDLTALRRHAASLPGSLPLRVNSELVATGTLPRGGVFAGEGFEDHTMVHPVFQLEYADGFGLIDSAFDREAHAVMGGGTFHQEAFERVQAALADARFIVATHEHGDHIRGLAVFRPSEALLGRLVMTPAQLGNARWIDQVEFPAVLREQLEPLTYDGMHALAPGVVLLAAPGHTPGTQMIFVKLDGGREYLFLGDVAWHMDQIRNLHYRPRLVTDLYLGEDRRAVLHQFRALHDLMGAEPDLVLVSSHDPEQREGHLRDGVIGAHFGR